MSARKNIAAQAVMFFWDARQRIEGNIGRTVSIDPPLFGANAPQVTMCRLCGPALAGSNTLMPT
jgi:hypothetical protein